MTAEHPSQSSAQSSPSQRRTGATLRHDLRLPWVTQQAVFDLSAPWQEWRTRQDLLGWAETRLRFRVACARGKHRIQVDPHTGRFTDVFRTTGEREKTEAVHMLWALGHDMPAPPPPCRTFETTLATWVGYAQPPHQNLWEPQWHGTMQALRTLVRTVQYLDAGLDLHAHQRWLELGITPATLADIRTHTTASGRPDAEEALLDALTTLTSSSGRLRRQRKDPTQALMVTLSKSLLKQMNQQDDRAARLARRGRTGVA